MIGNGLKLLSDSNIVICGIVRDCEKNLARNIKKIDKLCDYAKNYQVYIYENDSQDKTKAVLESWAERRRNVKISINEINSGNTIPNQSETKYNKYYSFSRISKMCQFRNNYMQFIKNNCKDIDFVIIVDLDVSHISLEGIVDSFNQNQYWDVITANGWSTSSNFRKRYHDTYALVEWGLEQETTTEEIISLNQKKWSFLKKGIPLMKVYSAYGGLAIYRYEAIVGLEYKIYYNLNDNRVQVKNEHFGLHKQIYERGFTNLYINPSMEIKYQSVTFGLIYKTLLSKFSNLKLLKSQ